MMFRLIKILFFLIIFGMIGLVVYSYFGDLSSPNVEIIQPVKQDES
jgi:hypothetical protein